MQRGGGLRPLEPSCHGRAGISWKVEIGRKGSLHARWISVRSKMHRVTVDLDRGLNMYYPPQGKRENSGDSDTWRSF